MTTKAEQSAGDLVSPAPGSFTRRGGREAAPPFCTPPLDQCTPRPRLHPRSEAVFSKTPSTTRLVGSFHWGLPAGSAIRRRLKRSRHQVIFGVVTLRTRDLSRLPRPAPTRPHHTTRSHRASAPILNPDCAQFADAFGGPSFSVFATTKPCFVHPPRDHQANTHSLWVTR